MNLINKFLPSLQLPVNWQDRGILTKIPKDKKEYMISESINLQGGTNINQKINYHFYDIDEKFYFGIGKPGKETAELKTYKRMLNLSNGTRF